MVKMIGKHKTRVYKDNGADVVRYHQTEVVRASPSQIELNTGGWFSNTTKKRMNEASQELGLGIHVHQKNFDWFVTHKGKDKRFQGNTMILKR